MTSILILYLMEMFMSQRKSPTYGHTLKQSSFRSSFGHSKSFGGVVAGPKNQLNKDRKSRNNGKKSQ
jgi:hypothetical protein